MESSQVKNNSIIVSSFVRCLHFAAEAHKEQRRKDLENTPYINHPIGVAHIISCEAEVTNLDLIRGSLLHDTVEDTDVVIDNIYKEFGDYIGDLVQEVTDDKSLPKQKRKDLQVVHAPTSSPQAKMVKMADKLYNLRDLERCLPKGWSEERRKEYFSWSLNICKGLRGVNSKLEEKLQDVFKRNGLALENSSSGKLSVSWPNHDVLNPLITAANLAAKKHSQNTLFNASNTDPFINHVISVAFILSHNLGVEDISVLCACLLYTVVVGKEDLLNMFGKQVVELIDELTYDHSLSDSEQLKVQISKAPHLSATAGLITAASALDSCRRLKACRPLDWDEERRGLYLAQAQQLSVLLAGTNVKMDKILNEFWKS